MRGQPPQMVKKWWSCGWKTNHEISPNLAKNCDPSIAIDLCTVLCVKTYFFHHEGAFYKKSANDAEAHATFRESHYQTAPIQRLLSNLNFLSVSLRLVM